MECGVKERCALEYKKEKSIAQRIISELASVGVEGVWTSSQVKGSALAGYFVTLSLAKADKEGQSPSLQRAPKKNRAWAQLIG